MTEDTLDWTSFWDIASPAQAAEMLIEFYGPAAANAATLCASSARNDGREADFHYWKAVFDEIRASAANMVSQ